MSFVTPLFWLGALTAAVPILLHLIRRESAHKIEFPTLMFLRKISKRIIRYQKLRHLLLLLARIMALLLLALAFMRPFLDRPQAAASAGRVTTAHVILLDQSMSMGYGDRWDRARKAAADIVRAAEPGDKVSLLAFSDHTSVLTLPATDFGAVLDVIRAVPALTDRTTRFSQALKIAEKAALDAGAGKRVIHLISDFQKSGWATDEHDFRLGPGIDLKCTDVGSAQYGNLALGDVQVLDAEDNKAGSLKIRCAVFNFGTEQRAAARVALLVDGRVMAEKRADVAAGATAGLEFDLPGLTSGVHDVALSVEDPGLTRDNRFAMTLQARSKIPVVSVEAPGAGRSGRSPSFFVANALNISVLSPYRLSAVTPQAFEAMGAIAGGLLLWNNVSGGGAAVQKKLQEFVKGGGGLVVVLADSTLAGDFSRTFGTWLPFSAAETAGTAARRARSPGPDDFALMTDLRMDSDVFRAFSTPHSGTFSNARFFDHARIQARAGGQVLARFDNGDPALVAADVGQGRVLVFASSADDATNDLPLKAVFAPFWHQIFRYLENYRQERQWLEVGDTIAPRQLLVDAAVHQGRGNADLSQAIVVMDPDRRRVPLAPGADVLALDRAGFYDVRTQDLNTSVAVNPLLRESDLAHGDAEEMAAGWMSTDARAPAVIAPDERATPEEQDRRERLWRYLLIGVLALLLLEGLLANRFILRPE